jgi:SAM-dependent methyltransferase
MTSRILDRTRSAFDRSVTDSGAERSAARAAVLEATKWFEPGDRDRRHEAILEVLDIWRVRSLLEVGSGAGDFYARMRLRLPRITAFTGVDLSAKMVALARHRHPGADFRQADILAWPRRRVADAAVAIGVFALLVDDPDAHWSLMRRLIRQMFALSRLGIVFDFYDFFSAAEARAPGRYFARELRRTDDTPIYCVHPAEVRRFAARLGAVALTRIHGVDGRVWRCVVRRRARFRNP